MAAVFGSAELPEAVVDDTTLLRFLLANLKELVSGASRLGNVLYGESYGSRPRCTQYATSNPLSDSTCSSSDPLACPLSKPLRDNLFFTFTSHTYAMLPSAQR